ncbi:MAG: M48 family metallopeptidase [Acidobacteria bacterium]|nr:M48 family metallopeptidase [Acidobacteriota bacterium]
MSSRVKMTLVFGVPAMDTTLPRQRSLVILGILGLGMALVSYLVVLSMAAVCAYVPIWLLLHASSLNFQLLALAFCGIGMAGAMVWSLLPRRDKFEEPGPRIDRLSQPHLFAELDRIAAALNEPLPKEVFLIPEMNAFVIDRGGIMGFGSRRVMGIGLPLVAVLNVDEFRAVLAHEFAHYYSGDTRLGPIVYRTRQTMIRTIKNMASLSGAMRFAVAQILHIFVMWILQGYWALYFRATQWISRRQEYRADELACHIAGAESLIGGLVKIHGGAAAFPLYWNFEVSDFLHMGYRPAITEGFELFVQAPGIRKQIDQLVEKELKEAKTDPYDSHPPLHSRIAAARRFVDGHAHAGAAVPSRTLFNDLLQEEARILSRSWCEAEVRKLKTVPWSDMSRSCPAMWADDIRHNAHLLGDMTPEDIPDAAARLAEIGSRIPDPKGRLLTPEQRTGRAADLINMALNLAIANAGWPLQVSPGARYFDVNGERFSVGELLGNLLEKRTTREEWIEHCRSLRIMGVRLAEQKAKAAVSETA